jgi:hypothetical protein
VAVAAPLGNEASVRRTGSTEPLTRARHPASEAMSSGRVKSLPAETIASTGTWAAASSEAPRVSVAR